MDKKWFVHVQGVQEGPLDDDEMKARIFDGRLGVSDHAWSEGMESWQRVAEIPELLQHLIPASTDSQPPPMISPMDSVVKSNKVDSGELSALIEIAPHAARASSEPDPIENKSTIRATRSFKRVLALGLGVVVCALCFFSWQQGVLDRFFMPFPPIAELGQEAQAELASAARMPLRAGATLAFSISQSSPSAPTLYVASNLLDGTVFEVRLHGLPETLLNETDLDFKMTLALHHRLGKSSVARPNLAQGSPPTLPPGQYLVTVSLAENQPTLVAQELLNSHLAPVQKKFTLLGGLRDETYSQLLRDYHAKLREQATAEAVDLSQLTSALSDALNQTREKFALLKHLPKGESRAHEWAEFHTQWVNNVGATAERCSKFKPGQIAPGLFYSELFGLLYSAWESTARVHDVQTAYLTTDVDVVAFDAEIDQASKISDERIARLHEKLSIIEKNRSQLGYPPKEGL